MNAIDDNIISISCIIPTLRRGSILCNTIRMLLAQSHPPHEIIVVDQTTSQCEDTRKRLESWHAKGTIYWLHQKEPNASLARNAGVVAATGNVVLLLDDDIRIAPEFLEAYAEAFRNAGTEAVCGPVFEGEGKAVDDLPAKAFDPEIGWLYFKKNYSKSCQTSFMMGGNAAIRRDLFLKVGGMDANYRRGAYREESDFAMRFAKAGYRFSYSPRCYIYHLGVANVKGGGARSWADDSHFWYFHHCVGDWYFNIKYFSLRLFFPLLSRSVRCFVINKQRMKKPWLIPLELLFWLSALPVAVFMRLRGALVLSFPRANELRDFSN